MKGKTKEKRRRKREVLKELLRKNLKDWKTAPAPKSGSASSKLSA